MARTQVPRSSTSASSVTLLAHGMRPLTVTAPRPRRSSASVNDMAIAARAHVTGGVHRAAAHGAIGAAALHQLFRAIGERPRLLGRDAHAPGGRLLARALTLLFLLEQPVGVDDDAAVLLVVSHAHGRHDPGGLGEGHEVHLRGDRAFRRAELGNEAGEIFGERPHLLLLALERDEHGLLARLQVEDALARLADGPGGEMIRLFEFEGDAHVIPSAARSPSMELTVSAAEPDAL